MMTPDEIKDLIRAEMKQQTTMLDAQNVQWLARAAFEAGWRAAGGDPIRSDHREEAVGWRKAWLESEPRAILVRQGLISGQDVFR